MYKQLLATLILGLATAVPGAAASTYTDALAAPVSAWVHAFNSGQAAFPSDAFTDDCAVIDEFPPFSWGKDRVNVRAWYADVVGSNDPKRRARFLAEKEHLVLEKPTYVRSNETDANVTFPAVYTYTSDGKLHTQRALFTVVERKTAAGWRINANAWAISSDD